MVMPLVPADDEVLSAPAQPVEKIDQSIRQLATEMHLTCVAMQGLGLAAPQVGVPLQVVVTAYGGTYINPVVELTGKMVFMEEACLSLPGELFTVLRSTDVVVRATTLEGEDVTFSRSGLEAQLFQHEFDHCQGVLLYERAV